mmetsp:Transcript_29567/g.54253  ORF Transcript_29567/g.54253 Transcript_29567/m.54253 type:complete len:214 (+) Transcript_29567:1604-2245(+)
MHERIDVRPAGASVTSRLVVGTKHRFDRVILRHPLEGLGLRGGRFVDERRIGDCRQQLADLGRAFLRDKVSREGGRGGRTGHHGRRFLRGRRAGEGSGATQSKRCALRARKLSSRGDLLPVVCDRVRTRSVRATEAIIVRIVDGESVSTCGDAVFIRVGSIGRIVQRVGGDRCLGLVGACVDQGPRSLRRPAVREHIDGERNGRTGRLHCRGR